MKTVGKQLQEARLAKNWTPELASRETKIKVDRLKDLEADDYSHFNNATYARGFVRTYARALGLDEYKILRQLDNKLPDDDTANIVSTEGGVAYLPETAMPPRVAHRDFTALYVVLGLGAVVMVVIAFVLFRAYQVGELSKWTGEDVASSDSTNNAPSVASANVDRTPKTPAVTTGTTTATAANDGAQTNAVATATSPDDTSNAPRALPVNAPAPDATMGGAPRALPVDPATLNAANTATATPAPAPVAAPAADDSTANAPRALPVVQAPPNNDTSNAPRALPVDPSTPPPAPNSTDTPVNAPRALPVNPGDANAVPPQKDPVVIPPSNASTTPGGKPLVLTASRDSFVRVTTLDTGNGKQVYSDVLHSGQSVAFNGHKFSVNVDNPSAVDIRLDGVNYGPHDDGTDPETFTVVSHVQ
jgi:cytoskeleton protein RodZ